MSTEKNNPVQIAVENYLQDRAASDPMFAASFAKPHKSIEECMRYILGEMYKRATTCPKGRAAMATDEEVYGLAVHYYDEEDISIENDKNAKNAKSCVISRETVPDKQLYCEERETSNKPAKTQKKDTTAILSLFTDEDFA